MALRNHRAAAAAALIGVVAGVGPVSAATAAASSGASVAHRTGGPAAGNVDPTTPTPPFTDPPAPGGGGAAPAGAPAPQTEPAAGTTVPLPSVPVATPQCGQLLLPSPLPTVIHCGPLTIEFNTVTTTNTNTNAGGPIGAGITSPPVITRRHKNAKTTRRTRRTASTKRRSRTSARKPSDGTRTIKVRLRQAPRPRL